MALMCSKGINTCKCLNAWDMERTPLISVGFYSHSLNFAEDVILGRAQGQCA